MELNAQTLLFILIGLVTAGFVLEIILDILNLRHRRTTMPDAVKGIYDPEEYRRALDYQAALTRFGFITSSFSFLLTLVLLLTGGFGLLDGWLRGLTDQPVLLALAFFGILALLSDIVSFPLQYYRTFVIEERFGFNRTTLRTFFLDKLKGWLLTAILGGGLLTALIWLIMNLGSSFWLYFWGIAALFMLLANVFYTSLIVPLFNKLTPLSEPVLLEKIRNYCDRISFPLKNVQVIDGSKRSTKANAFFSGLWGSKKVVLYDTLLANHSENELVAILAHEIGHYKKKHIVLGYVLSLAQSGLMLWIMSLVIFREELSVALGGEVWAIHLNLLAFGLLYSPVSTLLGIGGNIISRRHEYAADAFAGKTYDAEALQLALKKLSVRNLSNLFPHPAYVFVHYSHPPLLKRLKALDRFASRKDQPHASPAPSPR